MPEQRINYGTKTMVYSKKRKDTAVTAAPYDSPTNSVWDEAGESSTPLFVLVNKYDEIRASKKINVHSCYCADCRRQFDLSQELPELQADTYSVTRDAATYHMTAPNKAAKAVLDTEPTCPECGRTAKSLVFIPAQKKSEDGDVLNRDLGEHINYDGSWRIPPIIQGRYVFEYRDGEDRHLTRMDDNVMMENTVIFPSGKQFTWESEFSQTMDLVRHRIVSYETRIDGRGRTPVGVAQEVTNPFLYPSAQNALSIERKTDVQDVRQAVNVIGTYGGGGGYEIISFKDAIFGKAFGKITAYRMQDGSNDRLFANLESGSYCIGGISEKAISLMGTEVGNLKSHAVMETLKDKMPHPVYADLVHNGLCLQQHKKGSTEENTAVKTELRNLYTYMAARYPASVVYAAERAEMRAVNYEFAERRKAAETAGYEAKTATDSARAKFFREEMRFVSEQLCACDDKVLNEIRLAGTKSPAYVLRKDASGKNVIEKVPEFGASDPVQDMKDRLAFFVYGLQEGFPVPGDIAVKLKDARTLQDATKSTKKLKTNFNNDPIAVASNVYTLRKWGITNSDHVKQVLDLVAEQSPVVNPPSIRIKGNRVEPARKYRSFVNAGVLAPMRDRTAVSFAKLYGKTHDTSAMISEIFDNRTNDPKDSESSAKWRQFTEDVRLYGDLEGNPAVTFIRTKADLAVDQNSGETIDEWEQKKTQLRTYLDNNGKDGIRLAYRDFAGIYGENTVEMINTLAREIKIDRQMDEVKKYANENGMEETLSKYSEFLSRFDDPEQAVTDHHMFSDRTLLIATRNNKPLFERDLREIHDELSEMAKKAVTENEYLTLPDKVLAMNESIPVDLSKLPESQWDENPKTVPEGTMGEFTFHVLDNRFDFVRIATDLRNCVAGGSYFSSVKGGKTLIVSMKNENNQTCACIELKKEKDDSLGTEWTMKQLQGYRDSVVDRRYSEAIKEWAGKHKIDLSKDPDSNIRPCMTGERTWFYGAGNADFHRDEYDPVLNTTLENSKIEKLRKERVEKAIALYGGDEAGGPNLPEVPDDLRY